MPAIPEQLRLIRQKIATAAQAANRDPADIELIAVSKNHSADAVRTALTAEQNLFGENRVQEAKQKFTDLRRLHPSLQLHLIGPLQTNKAEDAVKLFDVIQTLDRPNLAEALAKAIRKTGKAPKLYIEVNIGLEPQKAGIKPQDLELFLQFCRTDCQLHIDGLMCIPPQDHDPEPFFVEMKKRADLHQLPQLSMGMSSDFETAIRCGATQVRIGTAIFGKREKTQ